MDLDELLKAADTAQKRRVNEEQRAIDEADGQIAMEDAWIEVDRSLKGNTGQVDLAPLLKALSRFPQGKQSLWRLRDAARAQHDQDSDITAGLIVVAIAAIMDGDADTLALIARRRTAESCAAMRQINTAIWQPEREVRGEPERLKCSTWQEVVKVLERMIRNGFPKCTMKELERKLDCHHRTITRAIKESAEIQEWWNRKEADLPPINPRKIQRLSEVAMNDLADKRETKMLDAERQRLIDEICAECEKRGKPEEAARVRGMDPDKQAEMLRLYKSREWQFGKQEPGDN